MLTRKMQGDTMLFYEEEKLILTVEETEAEGGILMKLKGNLRSDTAHHIQDELDAFVTVGVKVIMDMKEVSFVSPSFLKGILDSQVLIDFFCKGELILRNVPAGTFRELKETGIADLLMIEE